MDETYVKVAGQWRYVYRAIDQFGQVVDSSSPGSETPRPATGSSRGRWARPRSVRSRSQLIRRRCVYPAVLEERLPAAWHRTDRYASNRIECDHGRLKARLGPMCGLKQDRSARVVIAGHALVQNVRRGHYEVAVEDGPPAGD